MSIIKLCLGAKLKVFSRIQIGIMINEIFIKSEFLHENRGHRAAQNSDINYIAYSLRHLTDEAENDNKNEMTSRN